MIVQTRQFLSEAGKESRTQQRTRQQIPFTQKTASRAVEPLIEILSVSPTRSSEEHFSKNKTSGFKQHILKRAADHHRAVKMASKQKKVCMKKLGITGTKTSSLKAEGV